MLVNLKKQLSPTDRARERELIRLYQRVKAPPRDQNVEEWLCDFQRTYDRCRKLRVPDMEGDRAVYDFLSAVNIIEPGFTSYWRNRLIDNDEDTDDDENRITLYEIVRRFRQH